MNEDAHLDMEYEDRFEIDHGLGEIEVEESWEAGRDEALLDYEAEFDSQRAEIEAEMLMAQYDDDPSPYDGTYSEC